jgi:hypothetical protein
MRAGFFAVAPKKARQPLPIEEVDDDDDSDSSNGPPGLAGSESGSEDELADMPGMISEAGSGTGSDGPPSLADGVEDKMEVDGVPPGPGGSQAWRTAAWRATPLPGLPPAPLAHSPSGPRCRCRCHAACHPCHPLGGNPASFAPRCLRPSHQSLPLAA